MAEPSSNVVVRHPTTATHSAGTRNQRESLPGRPKAMMSADARGVPSQEGAPWDQGPGGSHRIARLDGVERHRSAPTSRTRVHNSKSRHEVLCGDGQDLLSGRSNRNHRRSPRSIAALPFTGARRGRLAACGQPIDRGDRFWRGSARRYAGAGRATPHPRSRESLPTKHHKALFRQYSAELRETFRATMRTCAFR